jgi:hypothetical protein
MNGQIIAMQVNLRDTATAIKERVKNEVGIPPNKQKFKGYNMPFIKDNQTLASYNLLPGSTIQLGIKERGGKNK